LKEAYMGLHLDAMGRKIGPLSKEYAWKDVVLYALGVGAGFEELEYVYEERLKPLPSFAAAAVFDFFWEAAAASGVNLAGVLHGEQDLVLHRPMPIEGSLVTEGAIEDIYDLGDQKGAAIIAQASTSDGEGTELFTNRMTIFGKLDGGFGGNPPPKRKKRIPERPPDDGMKDRPAANQPLIYRLSGDPFELHVDPEFARQSGFAGPIMHGLCTYGFACRACIKALVPGEPERVRRLSCRFSRPLYPGVPIATQIWHMGEGRASWRVVNEDTGEVVIDNGLLEYVESE
jgi:acyl dehydratase